MKRDTPTPKASEVVTLADLAPRRPILGGAARRVFGSDLSSSAQEDAMASKATRDLPSKKTVKGGRRIT